MFWVDDLMKAVAAPADEPINVTTTRLARDTTDAQKLAALGEAAARLRRDFGWWQVPWGDINRFQRISPAIDHPFSDAAPSIPVAVPLRRAGDRWPRSARRRSRARRNGTARAATASSPSSSSGNGFALEPSRPGGESGNPASPHFNDQAERYATGKLREVYFYPDQLKAHVKRRYRPGE